MSYGLNYLRLCYFSFQRETSLFLECGWQTHTLFYREVSLCLGLKPFLFHQLSWWFFFTKVLNKNPTISNVKSLDLWSEWRESNSRPLEPHSSALPKLRYTRISTAAPLPKRGDKRYYTQARPFCQQIFRLFLVFSEKSLIFTRIRAFSFLLFFNVFPLLRRAAHGRVPAAGADTGR